MEVDTKVRNTMLPLFKNDRNLLGIHGSFEAEETYTKEVLWVSSSCDHVFTDCFVESTARLHWNLGRKGIYEVQNRMVSHFSFQGGSELVKPTRFKVLGGAGIRYIHNRYVVELFPNVEGRHGRVMHLLDSCCGNFVLEAHSVRE